VQYTALEAEIAGEKQSFSSDIAAEARIHRSSEGVDTSHSTDIATNLGWVRFHGQALVIEAKGPDYSPYFQLRSQRVGTEDLNFTHSHNAIRLLQSNEDFRDLAAFSVWLASVMT